MSIRLTSLLGSKFVLTSADSLLSNGRIRDRKALSDRILSSERCVSVLINYHLCDNFSCEQFGAVYAEESHGELLLAQLG